MASNSSTPDHLAESDMIISRDFTISRNLLFEARTESVHLDNWWESENFQTSTDKFD